MRTPQFSRWIAATLAAFGLSLTAPASAQQPAQTPSLALSRFDPAPAGDRFFGAPSPYVGGELTPQAMLLMDYAHNPLVLRRLSTNENLGAIVQNQMFLHINGGIALWNRLLINIDAPLALVNTGSSVTPDNGATQFTAPSGGGFGDLRLGARVRLFGEYYDPVQLAIGAYLWFPTGKKGAFLSDGTVRGLPQVIIGGRTDRFVYTVAMGPEIRKAQDYANVGQGAMLRWGAGLGMLFLDNRNLQLGVEASGGVVIRDIRESNTNIEATLGVRYRVGDALEFGIGAGPGLSSGVGTPDFRGVAMAAWAPQPIQDRDGDGIRDRDDACIDVKGVHSDDPTKNGCPPPPPDRDGDGIIDAEDACPDVAGVKSDDPQKNGCPPDRDGDGIVDAEDACPDVKGVRSTDPKLNGCPPDRDGDGIIDEQDACPDVKGVADADPKKNGCPPDRDGDTIIDDQDACPDQPGPRNEDPKKNGCPMVAVTATEVFILEQVQFDVDRATIKKVSDGLLDNVAKVLIEHDYLTKVEVQGHTDNTGNKIHNKQLSQARADAVLKALVKRGVDKKRLTAVGYGQEKPIADNATEEGKAKNRRVQFVILERKEKGAAKAAEPAKPADKGAAKPPAKPADKAPAKPADKGAAKPADKGAKKPKGK